MFCDECHNPIEGEYIWYIDDDGREYDWCDDECLHDWQEEHQNKVNQIMRAQTSLGVV